MLKSRDNTLLIKGCIVKVMVFPVVTYGCDSWPIKKAEHQRTDAFELCCGKRLLKVPDAGKDRRQKEKRASEDETVGWHH